MRLLIVEPDAATAQSLRHIAQQQHEIVQVETADSAEKALHCVVTDAPDLLLIEVDLDNQTGFGVLRAAHPAGAQAIMMSRRKEHAIEAFRLGAIDYLLKPVTASQLLTVLRKAHSRIATGNAPGPAAPRSSRLIGERSNRYYFIEVDDVDFIEAYGNYVKIHVGTEQYLRRDTLRHLAAALSDSGFELVRRSTLINLKRVMFAEKCGEGALAFKLCSGARLVSRTRFKLDKSSLRHG
jgi:two-component system, LytTR family, response regulator